MKKLLSISIFVLSWSFAVRAVDLPSTSYSRGFLRSADAAAARAALGLQSTNQAINLSPDSSTLRTNGGTLYVTNSPQLGGIPASAYALTNDFSLAQIIGANASNGVNTVLFFLGDSMAVSAGGTAESAFATFESRLKQKYGWAGAGPTRLVDTGVGNSILSRSIVTNIYGEIAVPVYASDGSANVLSSKASGDETTGPITEIGVFYCTWTNGGALRLIHTATGINETNNVTTISAVPCIAYTNFSVSDALTDHRITFAVTSGTNYCGGFIMRNSTNAGVEVYYMARGSGTLSNMLVFGTNSFARLASQFHPDATLYFARDEPEVLVTVGGYAASLTNVLNFARGSGRVRVVTTPQKNGSTIQNIQNVWARQIAAGQSGWSLIPLADQFPAWRVNSGNGLMLDDNHPTTAGCVVWSDFLASYEGVAQSVGTNSYYVGRFSGDGSALTGVIAAGTAGALTNHQTGGVFFDGSAVSFTNDHVALNVGGGVVPFGLDGAVNVNYLTVKATAPYQAFTLGLNNSGIDHIFDFNGFVFGSDSFAFNDKADSRTFLFADASRGFNTLLPVQIWTNSMSRPAAPTSYGNCCFFNSNGFVYLLTSAISDASRWSKTNLIASP